VAPVIRTGLRVISFIRESHFLLSIYVKSVKIAKGFLNLDKAGGEINSWHREGYCGIGKISDSAKFVNF
jgi:hypothetical protein